MAEPSRCWARFSWTLHPWHIFPWIGNSFRFASDSFLTVNNRCSCCSLQQPSSTQRASVGQKRASVTFSAKCSWNLFTDIKWNEKCLISELQAPRSRPRCPLRQALLDMRAALLNTFALWQLLYAEWRVWERSAPRFIHGIRKIHLPQTSVIVQGNAVLSCRRLHLVVLMIQRKYCPLGESPSMASEQEVRDQVLLHCLIWANANTEAKPMTHNETTPSSSGCVHLCAALNVNEWSYH